MSADAAAALWRAHWAALARARAGCPSTWDAASADGDASPTDIPARHRHQDGASADGAASADPQRAEARA